MAVITVSQLAAAIRVGSTTLETAQVTRLLNVANTLVNEFASGAPEAIKNEAIVRVVGYLYDSPTTSKDGGYSNVLSNSGAGALLLPYRVHRAGSVTADAVAAANVAVGDDTNPVTDVTLIGSTLTITYQDGSTVAYTLAGGTSGSGTVSLSTRLPGAPVAMRLGWSQSRTFVEGTFIRANDHPIDGAAVGTSAGVIAPPFPPALSSDPTLYLAIWLAGNPDVQGIDRSGFTDGEDSIEFFPVVDRQALTVDSVSGYYYPSDSREVPIVGEDIISIFLGGGDLILGDSAVEEWAKTGNTVQIPLSRLGNAPNSGGSGTIADGSITTAKIDSLAVTGPKIASNAVSASKLANGAVSTAKIVDGAITQAKLAAGISIGTGTSTTIVVYPIIAAPAGSSLLAGWNSNWTAGDLLIWVDESQSRVTLYGVREVTQLGSTSLESYQISRWNTAGGSVEDWATEGNTDQIPANKLDNAAAAAIADGSITTAKLANDAVTVDKIHDDAVQTNQIQDGAVTETKIGDGAVTAAKLGSDVSLGGGGGGSWTKIASVTAPDNYGNNNAMDITWDATTSGYADSNAYWADVPNINMHKISCEFNNAYQDGDILIPDDLQDNTIVSHYIRVNVSDASDIARVFFVKSGDNTQLRVASGDTTEIGDIRGKTYTLYAYK